LCIIIFFKKNQQNAHSYPDKIPGYPRRFIRIFDIRRISDILYSNAISEQNIRIRIRYPKKSPDIQKFHPNQRSPSSNLDSDGYFPNHIIISLPSGPVLSRRLAIYMWRCGLGRQGWLRGGDGRAAG
jgi:hypothetical protein